MILGLTGCSSTSFFYNRLDTLIAWYADDYVELSRDQDRDMKVRIDRFLYWHRRTELPRYVALIDQALLLLDASITEAAIESFFVDVDAAASRLSERALEDMIEFGGTLSFEQRLEFVDHLEEQYEEIREERLEREEAQYFGDIHDQFEDNLEDYLGRLNQEQREFIDLAVANFFRADGPWLENRGTWLEGLRAIMESGDPGWPGKVRNHTLDRREGRSPEYAAALDNNLRLGRGIIRDVVNSRTPRQDRRLRKSLQGYRDAFHELAQEAD